MYNSFLLILKDILHIIFCILYIAYYRKKNARIFYFFRIISSVDGLAILDEASQWRKGARLAICLAICLAIEQQSQAHEWSVGRNWSSTRNSFTFPGGYPQQSNYRPINGNLQSLLIHRPLAVSSRCIREGSTSNGCPLFPRVSIHIRSSFVDRANLSRSSFAQITG